MVVKRCTLGSRGYSLSESWGRNTSGGGLGARRSRGEKPLGTNVVVIENAAPITMRLKAPSQNLTLAVSLAQPRSLSHEVSHWSKLNELAKPVLKENQNVGRSVVSRSEFGDR